MPNGPPLTVGNVSKARAVLEQGRLRNPKNELLWLAAIRLELRAQNGKAAEARSGVPKQRSNAVRVRCGSFPCAGPARQGAPRVPHQRGALVPGDRDGPEAAAQVQVHRRAEELRQQPACDLRRRAALLARPEDRQGQDLAAEASPVGFGRFDKSSLLSGSASTVCRAVALNPDVGDFWAFWLTFELQNGSAEEQAEVVRRCKEAEPHHGELWCRIAKDPANVRQPVDAILKKVAADASKHVLG